MIEKPNLDIQKDKAEEERRIELSIFLKHCREGLKREDYKNLPLKKRTRSKGLSRTEVAHLAGISVDWYTWLEQGRPIRPSLDLVRRIANAFNLSNPEERHLTTLAGYQDVLKTEEEYDTHILRRLTQRLGDAPSIVLKKNWHIIYQNKAANKIFGSWSDIEEKNKNLLYLFFAASIFTESLRQWEWHAKVTIRQYRAIYAENIGDLEFKNIIKGLSEKSVQFRNWWMEADVSGRDDGRKEFDHPSLGYLAYDYTILKPAERNDIEMITFIPIVK